MDMGLKFIKYLLFIFNLVFAISGIALIVAGAVIQAKYSSYLDFLGNQLVSVPVLFIIVGAVIFLIGFFGCCGAIQENACMTTTFAVLLFIILLCELGGGIALYVLRGEVKNILGQTMPEVMKNYNKTGFEGVTKTWDGLQHEFHCCGVNNFTDWFATPYKHVPNSCCKNDTDGCAANIGTIDIDGRIWDKGCLEQLQFQFEHNAGIVAGIAIGVACIQVLGIIFACMLASSIRRNYQTV